VDPHDSEPLEYATVFLEESSQGAETDSSGMAKISNVCPGNYHLHIDHALCSRKIVYITLHRDTAIIVELEHHEYYLQSVTIEDHKNLQQSAHRNTISEDQITKNLGRPLSKILESVAGVYSLKNGSTIAKPVIQGMSGNRIVIMNNGAVQAGQQWGSDHAPEVDPLASDQITVIKGVDAIPYGGNGLGGLVLMEPSAIAQDPHLHGTSQWAYENNGRQFSQFTKLERANQKWRWRTTLGAKFGGDRRSPDYFLSNTGNREISTSVYLMHDRGINKFEKIYFSYFFTELGILRGSHIGNLTDLQSALQRDTPLFTNPHFSYSIGSPRQKVHHWLGRYSLQRNMEQHLMELNASMQVNLRSEYDVRRGSRSNTPALQLLMQSAQLEAKDRFTFGHTVWLCGLQSRVNYNYNIPGTGIYPLIPDYLSVVPAVFIQQKTNWNNIQLDLGLRYDLVYDNVSYYQRNNTSVILRDQLLFNNFSGSAGVSTSLNRHHEIKFITGWTQRAPEINELYSNGLHQAVAGIEEGDQNLVPEKSLKSSATYNLRLSDMLSFEVNAYAQWIRDYIYLQPLSDYRLTIRGAFPVFQYRQTNATISGIDVITRYEWNHRWNITGRYSWISGQDISAELPLVALPPFNAFHSIGYVIPLKKNTMDFQTGIEGLYVGKSNVHPSQDFLPPPVAYFLVNIYAGMNIKLHQRTLSIQLRSDNLFNSRYRDYLNRLRYYSDAEGRSFSLMAKLPF